NDFFVVKDAVTLLKPLGDEYQWFGYWHNDPRPAGRDRFKNPGPDPPVISDDNLAPLRIREQNIELGDDDEEITDAELKALFGDSDDDDDVEAEGDDGAQEGGEEIEDPLATSSEDGDQSPGREEVPAAAATQPASAGELIYKRERRSKANQDRDARRLGLEYAVGQGSSQQLPERPKRKRNPSIVISSSDEEKVHEDLGDAESLSEKPAESGARKAKKTKAQVRYPSLAVRTFRQTKDAVEGEDSSQVLDASMVERYAQDADANAGQNINVAVATLDKELAIIDVLAKGGDDTRGKDPDEMVTKETVSVPDSAMCQIPAPSKKRIKPLKRLRISDSLPTEEEPVMTAEKIVPVGGNIDVETSVEKAVVTEPTLAPDGDGQENPKETIQQVAESHVLVLHLSPSPAVETQIMSREDPLVNWSQSLGGASSSGPDIEVEDLPPPTIEFNPALFEFRESQKKSGSLSFEFAGEKVVINEEEDEKEFDLSENQLIDLIDTQQKIIAKSGEKTKFFKVLKSAADSLHEDLTAKQLKIQEQQEELARLKAELSAAHKERADSTQTDQ
ncbi:hypothetical protein EJB05_44719, partial [Eragrostis curvula]